MIRGIQRDQNPSDGVEEDDGNPELEDPAALSAIKQPCDAPK
jgi:hypothetical protein